MSVARTSGGRTLISRGTPSFNANFASILDMSVRLTSPRGSEVVVPSCDGWGGVRLQAIRLADREGPSTILNITRLTSLGMNHSSEKSAIRIDI